MIRYIADGTKADFDAVIRYLERFPKILDKHAAPGMKRIVTLTARQILPHIPLRTGASRNALFSAIYGFGKTLTGVVGFRGGRNAPWYINVVEHGARPHSLVKGAKQRSVSAFARFQKRMESGALRGAHVFIGGQWRTIKSHPGLSRLGFMAAGYSAAQPIFNAEMQTAADAAIQEIKPNG
jgi:hypothetical protein